MAIFTKPELKCVALNQLNDASVEIVCEICAVYCETFDVVVACIYRSPCADFQSFVDVMDGLLTKLGTFKRTILSGDFNVRFGSADLRAGRICDLFASYGYGATVSGPTRQNNCLDNIFINFGIEKYKTLVVDSGLSDHRAQSITVPIDVIGRSEYTTVVTRPLTEIGYIRFFQYFSSYTWDFLCDSDMGVSDKYGVFLRRVLAAFHGSFQTKESAVRKCDNGLLWYSNSLRSMRDSYLFMHDLYSRYKTDDLLQIRNAVRSRYREAIDSAKRNANDRYIDNASNKTRAMWQVINGNRVSQNQVPDRLDVDAMNAFFVNVAQDTVAQLPKNAGQPTYTHCTESVFSFQLVSSFLIRGVIHALNNSNTKDFFGLSTKFIKRNTSLFVIPLSKLLNLTIVTAVFPDSLKIAKVIPIYKKGDKNRYENYRPISILPSFSKIYERVLYNQIAAFVESNNILHLNQYGFRKGKSTSDAVVKFVNICNECFERGEYCMALFLDLSRAFDCVSHVLLLKKLKSVFNFDTESTALIQSYLSGRTQQVICNERASSSLVVKRGVPQGSILGPLLFLMYFNDFPQCLGYDVECLLYADDATIIVRGTSCEMVQEKCNKAMGSIREWCIVNELCLNEHKTTKMLFSLKKSTFINPDPNRFLGVHITAPHLKFGEHASHVGTVISRNIFLLRNLRNAVSLEVAKTAYYALVHSHIGYSILAWGNGPAGSHLFRLQRRAVRLLGGLAYREECRQAFISLSIMTLPSIYILQSIIYAHSNQNSLRTCADNHSYDTRNKGNIYVQYCRLSATQRGPARMSQVLFNKLPSTMRSLPLNKLKLELKLFLISKAFYSIDEFLNYEFLNVLN